MPITIFGKSIGSLPSAAVNSGQKNSPGGTTKSGRYNAQPAHIGGINARQGATGPPASNAGSQVYAFNQTISPGNTFTYPLTLDGDFIAMNFNITMKWTASSAATDILNGITTVQIIAPDGPSVTMAPVPDFYLFAQRFSQYGQSLSVVNTSITVTTVTISSTANYNLPINLPAAKGPYTLVLTAGSSALVNTTVMV